MTEKRKRKICVRPARQKVEVKTGGSRTVEPEPKSASKKKAKSGGKE